MSELSEREHSEKLLRDFIEPQRPLIEHAASLQAKIEELTKERNTYAESYARLEEWFVDAAKARDEALALLEKYCWTISPAMTEAKINELNTIVDALKSKLAFLRTQQDWRPASEPPTTDEDVLIFVPDEPRHHAIGFCAPSGKWYYSHTGETFRTTVVAWMPLPADPEKEEG